jgi:hypothetical protein
MVVAPAQARVVDTNLKVDQQQGSVGRESGHEGMALLAGSSA